MKRYRIILIFIFIPLLSKALQSKSDSVKVHDIVINEIMADPTPYVGLPPYEYIELYNRTNKIINLSDWSLTVGTRTRILYGITIEPEGYLLLTDTASAKYFSAYGSVYGLTSLMINNTGQTIILKNKVEQIISAISFSDSWYRNDYKQEGGWALEQIDPANPCAGENNWAVSVDKSGGTPCRKNSVYALNPDNTIPEPERAYVVNDTTIKLIFSEPVDSTVLKNAMNFRIDNDEGIPSKIQLIPPFYSSLFLSLASPLKPGIIYHVSLTKQISDCSGNLSEIDASVRFAIPSPAEPEDIIINEILTNPKDNGAQFVEVYNRSQKVIDMKELLLCTMDTVKNVPVSQKTISDEGFLMFPGQYYLLTTAPDKVKHQYYTSNPKGFISLESFPQFNIDDGIIVLSDKPGTIIDKLVYSKDLQFALLNDTKGVSIERISFEKATQDKTNWHSAAESAGFATPAYKNSQSADVINSDNAITLNPEMFSPDNDGRDDILTINYKFDEPGYMAYVMIYDSKGRQIRNLVNNEIIGTSGFFTWDGINDKNEKALIGIYIVFVEIHNLKGKVKHYKKTVVLVGKI